MALAERTQIGQRTVLPDGQIQVRTDTIIERDGVEISRTYHRHVVAPGDDPTRERPEVARLMALEHTQAVIDAYNAARIAAQL